MASPSHAEYQKLVLEWVKNHAAEPDVAEALERYGDAAVVIWHLDLEPARPLLRRCYAAVPRGSKQWDPVIQLRGLLLSILVGQTSINKWADDLKGSRVLRVLCGIFDDQGRPGVGTIYDFLHRLHDGPAVERRAADRPSAVERRRAEIPRCRGKKAEAKASKAGRKRGKARKDASAEIEAATAGQVARLVEALQATEHNPAPMSLIGFRPESV